METTKTANELRNIETLFQNLSSKDDKTRYPSFMELLKRTDTKVEWPYLAWHELVEKLSSPNSFQRSIGFMLLMNLYKSDTEKRLHSIVPQLLSMLNDEKLITARQCLQTIWKIGLENDSIQVRIMDALENTFYENPHVSKNPKLIKSDIIGSLNQLYQSSKKQSIRSLIIKLIDSELDEKLKKELKKHADL